MTGCCGGLAASDESFALHDRLHSAAERLGYDLEYTPRFGGSDHLTYVRRRVPAIMLSGTDLGELHTARDTLATISTQRLRSSGEVVIQSLLEMGSG